MQPQSTFQPAVYVYEAPLRLWHWVNALAIVTLAITGYFIGQPLPTLSGEYQSSLFDGLYSFCPLCSGLYLGDWFHWAHILGFCRQ